MEGKLFNRIINLNGFMDIQCRSQANTNCVIKITFNRCKDKIKYLFFISKYSKQQIKCAALKKDNAFNGLCLNNSLSHNFIQNQMVVLLLFVVEMFIKISYVINIQPKF